MLAAAVALTGETDALRSLYESRGAVTSLRDDTRETIRLVWWMVCLLTFVTCVAFWLAGMPLWHALNHAMTGVTTGGFVVTDEGIRGYGSPLIEALAVGSHLLGAISIAVLYAVLRGDVGELVRDAQTRWLAALAGLSVAAVVGMLATVRPVPEAVRDGGFQAVSALTTGGFQTDGSLAGGWPPAALLVVICAMVVGGAAGATVGGIKVVRLMALVKGTLATAAPQPGVDEDHEIGQEVSEATAGQARSELERAATIGFLWIVSLTTVTVVSLVLLPTGQGGYGVAEVLFEVASAQGNVGLSTGLVAPGLPAGVKLALVASMWAGRLEIVPVLATLRILLRGGT